MAWTSSAYPGDEAARAQPHASGMAQASRLWAASTRFLPQQALHTAGIAHLVVLTATVFNPAAHPLPLLLVVTGLLLIVLSLSQTQPKRLTHDAAGLAAPAQPAAPGDRLDDRLALERQSQRLVEVADAATRARRDAELRSKVWADLTARISHELRTPLNAVIGFSDIMDAELFGPIGHDRYKDYSRHIRDSGQDLLKSTEDTLALTSCLGGPNATTAMVALDLDVLVADAWSFFGHVPHDQGYTLKLDIAPGLEVLGERRPLRQILVNLLTEAQARAPRGTEIRVIARDCGDLIELELEVASALSRPALAQAPLAICIARVLLELQASGLTEGFDAAGSWRATAILEHAAQPDFFAAASY